jgi:isochorismate pyruvate lyase
MNSRPDPAQVTTMVEVRAAVDSIDRALVALLAERMRFMDAAARIKPLRGEVRDETRKRQVLDNVGRHAAGLGLDPALAQSLWETLVEASIAHEFAMWDQLRR